jgi:hypothetical protein
VIDAEQAAVAMQAERLEHRALMVGARERYAAVQGLRAEGKGSKPIMRELGLAKETVRRFSRAASVEELLAKARDGCGSVWRTSAYLHRRCNDGGTNASQLVGEICEHGDRSSLGTVIDDLRPFRGAGVTPPAPPTPSPPKVRNVACWILTHLTSSTPRGRSRSSKSFPAARTWTPPPRMSPCSPGCSPACRATGATTGSPRSRPTTRPGLPCLATGLKHDYAAVRNGLTLPHGSGAVEDNVNRIKLRNRQLDGRAGFDLLRNRVLLSA